jgi:hypothetical protein
MTVTYPELVAAATVGIAQRPVEVRALAGPLAALAAVLDADPAGAVLDAAALFDAARRSGGLRPAPIDLPPAAPADTARELTAPAAAILRAVLATADRELIGELLQAAARAGFRAPAPDLPALLALAARDAVVRPAVAAVLGERGRWLAALQPEWRRVADASAPAAVDPQAWQTGRLGERVAWLTDLRRRDPAAARELLAAGWARETGDDRPVLLAVLQLRLGPEDEPFLEAALEDRKAEVRQGAARLLAALPTSAFAARAAARAEAALRRRKHRLIAVPPDPFDSVAGRDGLSSRSPYKSLGDSGWRLVQVIAAAPLALWPKVLDADPATLAAIEVPDFVAEVHAGWRLAARRERAADWAQALLANGSPAAFAPPDSQLLEFAPRDVRVARALAALRGSAPPADVRACPVPWPAEVTDATFGYVTAQLRAATPAAPGSLPALAARAIDLGEAAESVLLMRELADRFRIRSTEVPSAGRWPAALERAADILDLRRRFHGELH